MSNALAARRMSRSRLPQVSPSLRRPPPERGHSPARATPPGSPSILGPPEAPCLPHEDDEDDGDDWDPAVTASAPRASGSPSLRRRAAPSPRGITGTLIADSGN